MAAVGGRPVLMVNAVEDFEADKGGETTQVKMVCGADDDGYASVWFYVGCIVFFVVPIVGMSVFTRDTTLFRDDLQVIVGGTSVVQQGDDLRVDFQLLESEDGLYLRVLPFLDSTIWGYSLSCKSEENDTVSVVDSTEVEGRYYEFPLYRRPTSAEIFDSYLGPFNVDECSNDFTLTLYCIESEYGACTLDFDVEFGDIEIGFLGLPYEISSMWWDVFFIWLIAPCICLCACTCFLRCVGDCRKPERQVTASELAFTEDPMANDHVEVRGRPKRTPYPFMICNSLVFLLPALVLIFDARINFSADIDQYEVTYLQLNINETGMLATNSSDTFYMKIQPFLETTAWEYLLNCGTAAERFTGQHFTEEQMSEIYTFSDDIRSAATFLGPFDGTNCTMLELTCVSSEYSICTVHVKFATIDRTYGLSSNDGTQSYTGFILLLFFIGSSAFIYAVVDSDRY